VNVRKLNENRKEFLRKEKSVTPSLGGTERVL
jgi:hypothetical protein